ncbi:MAG: co-chaperone GroES [Dehalococcoidales bacterium]|nr:co-chaperone GroES [Dehalococcoidales bacterium]
MTAKTKTTARLEPLGDRIVVRPIERHEMSKGGIILPDTAKEKPQEGEVVAVGPGKMGDDSQRIAMSVKTGDKVVFAKYSGTEVELDDEKLLILHESDIMALRI